MSEVPAVELATLLSCPPEYGANAAAGTPNGRDPRYLRITDIDDAGRLLYDDIKSIPISVASPYLLAEEDITIARTGNTVGKSYIHRTRNGNIAFAGYLIKFQIDKLKASPQFVFHFLHSPIYYSWVRQTLRTGAQPNINASEYKKLLLPFYPLPEQRKIARILSTVDRLIEKTEALIEKYKSIKQGMMHDLFTRGLDQNGQLRPPHEEAPELYKESELGWIPKEWEVEQVGQLCDTASGGTPSRAISSFWNGHIPWVKTGEVRYKLIEDTEEKITEIGLASSAARFLPIDTVIMALFGQGPTRGRVARLGIEASVNQACLAFLPSNEVSSDYLYFWFVYTYKSMRKLSNDGAQQNLNASLVKSITMPLPKKDEQNQIASMLNNLDRRVEAEQDQLKKLFLLKSGLMQDLLTGKVRVKVEETEEIAAHA